MLDSVASSLPDVLDRSLQPGNAFVQVGHTVHARQGIGLSTVGKPRIHALMGVKESKRHYR